MLKVTNIQVQSFSIDYLDLFWEVETVFEDICNYTFVVEKSAAEFGPYYDLTGEFRNKFRLRDNTVKGQHSFYSRLYYRIRVRNTQTDETATYPTTGAGVCQGAPPDLAALEIARLETLKLKEHKGRMVWVFPRKGCGQRCSCYDNVTRKRTRSMCPTCFDTGWVGGYDSPIQTYAQIQDPSETNVKHNLVETEVENGVGLFGNYPDLAEGWVVVEQENVRWRIGSKIDKVAKARATVRQVAQLHRIYRGDIEYSLPMNIDEPEKLIATPFRNYLNPSDLEVARTFGLMGDTTP